MENRQRKLKSLHIMHLHAPEAGVPGPDYPCTPGQKNKLPSPQEVREKIKLLWK